MYSKLPLARSRGVAAKHAALSRPRSWVRIPSGPHEMYYEKPGAEFHTPGLRLTNK